MANDARLIFRGTDEAEAARRAHEAALPRPQRRACVEANRLRELCLHAGAVDVGDGLDGGSQQVDHLRCRGAGGGSGRARSRTGG
jgi:hypothetical protein